MTLKVYISPETTNPLHFDHFVSAAFDWGHSKVQYTTNIEESNLIPICDRGVELVEEQYEFIKERYNGQQICVLNIFHIGEYQLDYGKNISSNDPYYAWSSILGEDKVIFVHHNKAKENYKNLLYYDLMFERAKVYYTRYDAELLSHRIWVQYSSSKMFELEPIVKTKLPKHFLSPNRTYEKNGGSRTYRMLLKEILDHSKGYASDHVNGIFLMPQEITESIKYEFTDTLTFGGGMWAPVHNNYYNDSFVSIYVETLTHGTEVRSVTEKTFDPLIKGHFILPFGYKGLIKDIQSYGFMLPDWIDYSYDDYDDDDDDTRWKKYSQSVTSYLNMNINDVMNLYKKDEFMLHHNRSLFYSRPIIDFPKVLEDHIRTKNNILI